MFKVDKSYLSIDQVLVPPDGDGHHGVAVGHDDHRDDVLGGQHEHVVVLVPPSVPGWNKCTSLTTDMKLGEKFSLVSQPNI